MRYPRLLPVGDSALTVEFSDTVSEEANACVVGLGLAVEAENIQGVVDVVPSYRSLLICFDPLSAPLWRIAAEVARLLAGGAHTAPVRESTHWTVPLCYEGDHAPDLAYIAQSVGRHKDDVVALHGAADYRVQAIGFVPGMPYLAGLPESLSLSRRLEPRPPIPVGSVAIAMVLSAILPLASISAWHVIGRTPLLLLDMASDHPFAMKTGDTVRFRRIAEDEFARLGNLSPQERLQEARR